ncbi:hypothetical protein LshimejAT787_0301980 [Lyophyllum shimeji]|uniref:Homeobox domain-containing protein n=1 Tax=Lyophyllum shimeji TaxID=47721 RepID=A0A9P3PH06_LYOSH|nr:hypothetical protein LshimejAT787_0301980 [Lyophyllum shimeji]
MDCQQLSCHDTFRRINAVAHNIRALCRRDNLSPCPPLPTPNLATRPPALHLPVPKIPAALENASCSQETKVLLESTFFKAAHELREMCFAKHDRVARFVQSTPCGSSQATHSVVFFEREYQEQLRALEEMTVAKVISLQEREGDPTAKMKPTFNREFIPLLETYFRYNAYPSAVDRATLARKSMMTSRQIEVWFQNHRSRAKKEGRELKKLTADPLPLELSLKSLEKKMPTFVIPEDQRKDPFAVAPPSPDTDREEDEVVTTPRGGADAKFNIDAPPHAFPAVYPPRCDYDPFPIKTGAYKFSAPVWYRTPSAPRRAARTPIDLDALIADFDAKLHLRAPASQIQRSESAVPWYASRITVPSSAPHPALIIFPIVPTLIHTERLPAVRAPSSRPRPFRSPSPFSEPTTLVPQQPFDLAPTRRKIARLPRRTPKNMSIAHRRGSPAISEASPAPSRSSSSSSRTSSFGSQVSSDRRPSSSSGSSTSSLSAPTTPELPRATLPGSHNSYSSSVSDLDSKNLDNSFGDRTEILSPVDGVPFNFSLTAHPKQAPVLIPRSPLPAA